MSFIFSSVRDEQFADAYIKVQALFNRVLIEDSIHNASWHIYSPSKEINWSFVGGEFSSGEKPTSLNPFHTASIGKTFTATAIAMLYEQNRLRLTDQIKNYLSTEILDGLHVFQGSDYTDQITIEQLLQHTSGLPNYFDDKTTDGSPNGMSLLFSSKDKYWTPEELISISKTSMEPHFRPGTGFRYNDTGYVLLGLIVEKASGLQLHDFFRQYIFSPLKMKNTYMHLKEQPSLKTMKMSEVYAGNIDISKFKSLSLDWAGGGLVSTAKDLNRFQYALHNHQLLSPATLTRMKAWTAESNGLYYGLGLRKVNVSERFAVSAKNSLIGHTGSTSSFMFFCPELDIYLSGTLNQISHQKQSIQIPFEILNNIEKYSSNED